MVHGDPVRRVLAMGVAEWQTYMEHAAILGEDELVFDLRVEQVEMLLQALHRDGYLFYPGHTNLAEGVTLARRYYTEHYQ